MARNVKLNSRGIEEVAKSREMRAVITDLAEQIADNARAQGVRVEGEPGDTPLPVEVSSYITDRARSSVILAHPAGLAVQAKHGTLSRAASQAGLTVRGE
jgi:hypothetical protein